MTISLIAVRPLAAGILLLALAGCSSQAANDTPPTATPVTAVAPQPKTGTGLRLMALGDSITRGSGSGYGNYRRPLQALLAKGGRRYQFVGTSTEQSLNYHGSDPEQNFQPFDPYHEGYGGFRIDQIASDNSAKDDGGVAFPGLKAAMALDRPDVILLMLGTNDVNQNYDPGGPAYGGGAGFAADAAARLDGLIGRLYEANPKLVLLVAEITPLADPAKEANVRAYNALVAKVVAARRARGQTIRLADMHAAVPAADLSPDGVHPATIGYDKMARAWYAALTGKAAAALPTLTSSGAPSGRLEQSNLFGTSCQVAASPAFAGGAFYPGNLLDGTNRAYVFGKSSDERVTISGFKGPIARLRFFDTPSYTGRTPGHVTVAYARTATTSLKPGDYTALGTYPFPVVGDAYESKTNPASHPAAGDPASHPDSVIGFCEIGGLEIPADAKSILLDFSKMGGDGDGLTEIQAFGLATK
jgi:hypothetical protein